MISLLTGSAKEYRIAIYRRTSRAITGVSHRRALLVNAHDAIAELVIMSLRQSPVRLLIADGCRRRQDDRGGNDRARIARYRPGTIVAARWREWIQRDELICCGTPTGSNSAKAGSIASVSRSARSAPCCYGTNNQVDQVVLDVPRGRHVVLLHPRSEPVGYVIGIRGWAGGGSLTHLFADVLDRSPPAAVLW
jgi:hypothetical protein